jgi:hypothetical protein
MGVRTTWLIVLTMLGFSSMATGCSWLFTQPLPKAFSVYDVPPCSTNRVPPVLDTLFAVTNTASAIYVAGRDNVTNKATAVSVGVFVAALWTLSAIYGYKHTSECEDAQEGHWSGSSPARRTRPATPGSYLPPAPRPAETAAPAPVVPAQAPAPAAPPAPQQQDDDDPSMRRPGRPRLRPIEPNSPARPFGRAPTPRGLAGEA